MKRATKIWLGIAAFLIVVGGAVFCFAMAKTNWDFSAFGNPYVEVRETRTVEITEAFRDISIVCNTEAVSFLPSEDGKCSVQFYEELEKQEHTAVVENGTLSVGVTDTRKWYERISFFSYHAPRITVYLPEAAYGELFVEGDTGNITLPENYTFESIDLTVGTGDVACRAFSAGQLSIKTDTGDVSCDSITAGAFLLVTSTGRLDVRSVTCAGAVEVNAGTGKAVLKDVACQSLLSAGGTGDLVLDHVTAAETISVERTTGDVNFEQSDAAELLVVTETGDVTGSLLSTKVFVTQTDTGRVDVPQSTTGGKCRIVTDTGDIAISVP